MENLKNMDYHDSLILLNIGTGYKNGSIGSTICKQYLDSHRVSYNYYSR